MLNKALVLITLWSCFICINIGVLMHMIPDYPFFRIGPHDDFIIFGIKINTYSRYIVVILYSFMNAIVRATLNDVVTPHIVNVVQGNCDIIDRRVAYYSTSISAIYTWIDWIIYMNILLTQIDMPIVEMIAHVMISTYTTRQYINKNKADDELYKPLDEFAI